MKKEPALAAANDMLIAILNGMESMVFVVDICTYEIVYVNQCTERRFNKKIKVGGVCWEEFQCGQDGPCSLCNMDKLVDEYGNKTHVHVCEFQSSTSHRWYHVQTKLIHWIDGRQVGLGVVTDVTDQKELAAFLLQHQQDIGLAARLSVAGEMVSGLAHELSQPLGAASNYLHGCMRLIESGKYDLGQLSGAIKSAYNQTERAGKIISHLRNFIHKGSHDRQWVDINQLVHGAIQFLGHEIQHHRIRVSFDLSDLPLIHANPIELEQVLINLLKNAIESMQASASRGLDICTRLLDFRTCEVEIRDTGKGILASRMDRIFNPFSSSKADGLGLGLSICRRIVESYGGRIEARSTPDAGSVFRFALPLESHA